MYEIPTLNSVVYTCRLHVDDMFDEMLIMANRGLVKALINHLLFHHCFRVLYLIMSFHSFLGSGLGSGPEKWHITGKFRP